MAAAAKGQAAAAKGLVGVQINEKCEALPFHGSCIRCGLSMAVTHDVLLAAADGRVWVCGACRCRGASLLRVLSGVGADGWCHLASA